MRLMDGMLARGILKTLVIFILILAPFLLSGLATSEASSMDDVIFKEPHVSLDNSVLIAGRFHYFDVTLDDDRDNICIIAYVGDSLPDFEDRSYKNYYRWEYDNGAWKDVSGHESSYIDSSKCQKENHTYSFYIGIDSKADKGRWTIKVIVDNEEISSTSSFVVVVDLGFFLSAMIGVFEPYIRDKNPLFSSNFICSDRKRIIVESEKNIEERVDEILRKHAASDQEESADETLNLFVSDEAPLFKGELVKSTISTYSKSKLKKEQSNSLNSLFFNKKLGGGNGFWPVKFAGYNKFLAILVTIIILSVIFVPAITSNNNGSNPPNITVINVQSYPIAGGNWTVMFTTVGAADLTIAAVNGTTWSNIDDDQDLKFLELKSGNETLDYEWMNNSVFIANYFSNETGYETSKVLTTGIHTLMFCFGDDIAFAHNLASEYWLQTTTSDFNNGTKDNINVSSDSFHLNGTYSIGNTTLIDNESFEDATWPPTGWSATGNWNREGDQAYHGSWSADFDGFGSGASGDLDSLTMDCSDSNVTAIYIDFYYRDEAAEPGEFDLYYYNGSNWNYIGDLAGDTENQWNNYNEKITDSQYFVSSFQIRWSAIAPANKEYVYVDLVNVTLEKNLIEYAASGNVSSETHDTGRMAPNYTGIIVDNSTPSGTSITTWVRAANTEANLTSATWYTDINQVPNQRWVQWNISLTSDGPQTPTVNEVNLTWNYDNDKPTSSANIVSPYWQNTTPFEITATASDTGDSGIKEVALYYNYSTNNISGWTGWALYGANDTTSPYNWSFTAPEGDGYYRFYSIAIDNESNVEDPPISPNYDNFSGVDTADPISEVDAFPQYWYDETDNPLSINVSSATDTTSGVKNVTLYYRYREDNISGWGSWGIYGSVDESVPWSWSFNFPDGPGHYQFYSIAADNASNYENPPVSPDNDTRCGYSANKPTSEVDSITPYWRTTSPLTITGQATDYSGSGLKNVTLYFYNSSDNISWLGPWTYGVDSDPWNDISWSFNFPNGTNYYRFYSIAIDNDTNVEDFADNDTICGYDTSAPSSQVDSISPYWQNSSDNPLTINVTSPSDDLSGVSNVTLYWYNSTDNSTWSGPWSNGTDSTAPYSWGFTFSNGSGYYRFYSIANDAAGNQENPPATNDTICGYDTSAPSSQVDTISSYWQNSSDNPLTINVTNPSDDLSGVANVTLYWYNSTDNSTWSGPWSNGTDFSTPYSWNFVFSNGSGYYRFYSIVADNASNYENPPVTNDTICGYDTSAPSSQVDSISPYWKYGADNPLTIDVTGPSDDLSGVKNITLHYRYRFDNESIWDSWISFGVDTNAPWSWLFNFPNGTGHYEFYSIAADNASNYEDPPATNDTRCGYELLSSFTKSLWSESNSVSSTELTLTSSTDADGSVTGTWADANGKWAKSPYEYWDFTIEDSDVIGPINSVTLYLKHNQSGWSDDNFLIQIWNGSSWFNVQSYTAGDGPPTVDTTDNWDVKVLGVDTWDEINAAVVRIIGNGQGGSEDTVDWLVDTVELRVDIQSIDPIINSYNLLNATGSKLNNITGLLDVNNEYYFSINVTDGNGWADILYIDIKAWYDQGSDSTTYNQTLGGNLNMYLRYENLTGTSSYTMQWPDDEAQIISGNCTETIINETTRIINISFKPGSQVRWAGGDGAWDTTQNVTNDQYSWNFNILVKDNNSEEVLKKDEYGVYRYISIQPDSDWIDVYSVPGSNDDSSVVTITYSSNYDFNMSIYFEENLTNTSRAETITIADNVDIKGNTDPNDDITEDITFQGIGEENAVDIFNVSGVFHSDDSSQTVQVQFKVYIPFGTHGGKYTARVAIKIVQD